MKPWWVKFEDREPACVHTEWSDGEDRAIFLASEATGAIGLSAKPLPYTASPQVGEKRTEAWCRSPEKCAGFSSCPHRYACSN